VQSEYETWRALRPVTDEKLAFCRENVRREEDVLKVTVEVRETGSWAALAGDLVHPER
jgi:hypothetical protein